MTKNKHPTDRRQRLSIKKKKFEDKKFQGSEGQFRKLSKENIKEQETYDELKEYQGH